MRTRYVLLLSGGTLCAGVALGALLARHALKAYLMMAHLAYGAGFSAYIDVQHFKGTPAAYEAALTDHLHELDTSAQWPTDAYPKNLIAFDRVITYARMSDSQARRGANQESARSLETAAAICQQLNWKSCSGPEILALVKRFDEHYGLKSSDTEPHAR